MSQFDRIEQSQIEKIAKKVVAQSGGGGVTDHGALTGLGDDDHTQYHNDARGDARYSQLAHTHVSTNITDFNEAAQDAVGTILVSGTNTTAVYTDGTPSIAINVTGVSLTGHTHPQSDVTSLETDLAGKAAVSHTHTGADITSGTVDPLRLGSGASIATKFLQGDSTWQTIAGGGTVTNVATGTGLTGGPITGTGTISAVYGTALNTICQGNDGRLSDARTPTAHNHAGADITSGTVSALRLGSGTPDATRYLRGDGTWQPHIVELAEDTVTSFHIADGTIVIGDLSATGTPGVTTFLRGDNTWAVPAGGSGITFQDSLRMGTIL